MGSLGNYIVDINKVLFGSLRGSLGAAGSQDLGDSIYNGVQGAYQDLGLGSLRG